MVPRLGTPRSSDDKPKSLAGILLIPQVTPRSPLPNQQVALLHEAATPVGYVQSAYEGVSEHPDGGKEALVLDETYHAN